MMRKIFLTMVLFIAGFTMLPLFQVQSWNFDQDPVAVLSEVNHEANDNPATRIQNTDLDVVTSHHPECEGIAPDSRFTLTRTLCSIKENIKDYLQYVMYIGLTAATILLIRNGFKIVTASDQGKQIGNYLKRIIYIVIGVVLLIGFYYIIDIFVSVVNLIAE